ncbi:uncharacterized protein LOC141720067 [Apium graveolens]|uniref:uncharacterized protein LOC141720067 n=1 Tax=Apium graveolens TaxID=4045 RepID=UPI003D7A201B
MSINEYYTAMKTIWEELDSLNTLPVVTTVTPEVTKLLADIAVQREEGKLFQFLNGLNEMYSPQRSQLLLMTPLPTVESASATLQQEEAQRDMTLGHKPDTDVVALYGKGPPSKVYQCTLCGGKGHSNDRCWTVVGYPQWHPKNPANQGLSSQAKPSPSTLKPRWKSNYRSPQSSRMANVAQSSEPDCHESPLFSEQQLQQLAQFMQHSHLQSSTSGGDIPESPFSGMISCYNAQSYNNEWIIDSGASDHMTPCINNLEAPKLLDSSKHINLPTGATARISHIDNESQIVKAVGQERHGLYYLVNTDNPMQWLSAQIRKPQSYLVTSKPVAVDVWHHRLGHLPMSKLQLIPDVPKVKKQELVCLSCPMAKFSKLPFELSDSRAAKKFDLIHLDI